ncbi:MAG TPA: DUF1501 domain-containing protein [Acidimicrobiales bacterium]|nr:DUF1501 domain-containing protein [Acidimicrobiales bacterium]
MSRSLITHPVITRRRFIGAAAAAGTAGAAGLGISKLPWDLGAHPAGAAPPPPTPVAGPLVLVTLAGGNDGLNTVIPYQDPLYLAGRPALGYQPDQVIPLGEGLGLHPNLKGFKSLWDAGHLAVVRGVGYPNPVLSHFDSMAIWQSGQVVGEAATTGWVGRWLDGTAGRSADPLRAITVGSTLPLLMAGAKVAGAAVPNGGLSLPGGTAFARAFQALARPDAVRSALGSRAAQTDADLLTVQAAVSEALATVAAPTGQAPTGQAPGGRPTAGQLSAQLDVVSRLIRSGLSTRVYSVSLNGFDTHATEKDAHARLLAELDGAVTSFLAGLAGDHHGAGTVVATFSEFGRRVAANASGGTDHGTAAPLFVAGAAVKGGFHGDQPPLDHLDSGNLEFTTDFRRVYASLLSEVVGVDPASVLGPGFAGLPFL